MLKVGGLLEAYKEAVLPLHEHRQRESLEQLANPITRKSEREMRRKIQIKKNSESQSQLTQIAYSEADAELFPLYPSPEGKI